MRVMITTVTCGGGHVAAAGALEEAWKELRPDDVVDKVDLVKFFSAIHRKLYSDGYVTLVNHAPELWGYVFGKTDRPEAVRRLSKLRRLFPSKSRSRFAKHVQEFRPDVVLCTHYLPLETLEKMRGKANGERDSKSRVGVGPATGERLDGKWGRRGTSPILCPMVATVVTDFEAHALWMNGRSDVYFVAAHETRARLLARGAIAQNIVTTGIPVASKFASKIDLKAARREMGLRDDLPAVLVPSGGFGMGPVGKIVDEVDKVDGSVQILVVTGRNEALRKELAKADRRHPTRVFGFVTNMHELMAISDLIITKPGGLTSSEALAMGKPLLIINPIPGQEAANSDFLLEHGVAAKVNRAEDIPFRLGQFLGSKKLVEMGRAARALGRPDAARAICEEVVRRFGAEHPDRLR
ncbi:MAG: hypothetical protein C5B50_02785 [Verrucomicrobia bacterium]|nr:MAG: hypothetical protein C5B50_02785 [Verrucomicrobiota bacterium]